MSRIAFVTWNGGGNLAPALAIAQELHRRGHRAVFLSEDTQKRSAPDIAWSHQAPPGELYDATGRVLTTGSYRQAARRLARITGQHDGPANAASALQDLAVPPTSVSGDQDHLLALVTCDHPHLIHGPPVRSQRPRAYSTLAATSRAAELGDRPVVTPYEIRDGRRIETTLLEGLGFGAWRQG